MIKDILRVKYGDTFLSENFIFKGGNPEKAVPIILSVFLIITDTKKILVDAGCETMPGFNLVNFKTPMAALNEMGYDTDDITDVIITHSHYDHIDCVRYFKNAVIHIQSKELLSGRDYIPKDFTVNTFEDEIVICDGVKAVKSGGHTEGSSVVECRIGDRTVALCGDECYTFYNIKNKVPTATTVSYENSKAFIEKYSSNDFEVLLCHDL